ncbi:GSCOCG00009745001-RA-CDS, partial [Cotesia congregata]
MSSDESGAELSEEEIIKNLDEAAKQISNNLLPEKSKVQYNMCYQEFLFWQRKKKTDSFNENVLLVYFHELLKTLKPPTMWSRWSMLRTTINLRNGIDINNYHNLKVFIKNCAKGCHSKKARVLTLSQVILTFRVLGALRTSEICNLNIQDIEDTGSQMIVTINDNKNCYPRNFVIGKEYYGHVKKYISLRPNDFDSRRKRQIIGKNKISEVPRKVAEYLELEHPEAYTGHCFRRTAATLLANSGANLTAVKQLGEWRSSTTAEGYIEHSLANRRQIYQQIISSHQEISPRSTSNCQVPSATITNEAPSTSTANQNNPKTNL